MARNPANVLEDIADVQKQLRNLLDMERINRRYRKPRTPGLSDSDKKYLLNKSRLLINEMTELSQLLITDDALRKAFGKSYNQTRRLLQSAGLKPPSWNGKGVAEINQIKQDIVVGKLKAGQKMPSVRDLAGELKVNPNTIQRAYLELERENITFTKRGMGTYLTLDERIIRSLQKEISGKIIQEFIDGMNQIGFSNEKIIEILQEHL